MSSGFTKSEKEKNVKINETNNEISQVFDEKTKRLTFLFFVKNRIFESHEFFVSTKFIYLINQKTMLCLFLIFYQKT